LNALFTNGTVYRTYAAAGTGIYRATLGSSKLVLTQVFREVERQCWWRLIWVCISWFCRQK